jgi:small ligand-binding sensory domain FIST
VGVPPPPGPPPTTGFRPHTALVHAEPSTPELGELIGELARRVDSRYLFGGLASSRTRSLTIAADGLDAGGVLQGGLSGVAFASSVGLLSRVTQGCQPIGGARRITESERNIVYALDGEPALDCLLRDLGVDTREPRAALPRLRSTLVGLSEPDEAAEFGLPPQNPEFATPARLGSFGTETRVRHLVGIDPQRRGIAIADLAPVGQQLAFCRRDVDAARRDLVRIGAEIRSALEPEDLPLAARPASGGVALAGGGGRRILGALYISCTGRGGAHFGAPSAELQLVRHALGGTAADGVPLAGFFAAGEIGHRQLYGYTGVLTVFTAPA